MEPADLIGFIGSYTADASPSPLRSRFPGYAKFERTATSFIGRPLVSMMLKQTEHIPCSKLLSCRIARTLLGTPTPAGDIAVTNLRDPQNSLEIAVRPGTLDPVLVLEGDVAQTPWQELLVRDPNERDLEILNTIAEALAVDNNLKQ